MLFGGDDDLVALALKLHEGDDAAGHELGGDGAADEAGESRCAHGEVLFDLDNALAVPTGLGLNGEDVVDAAAVEADVDFIGFHLPGFRRGGAQMALQRVADRGGEKCQ